MTLDLLFLNMLLLLLYLDESKVQSGQLWTGRRPGTSPLLLMLLWKGAQPTGIYWLLLLLVLGVVLVQC
jgi:hypothetical protein